MALGGRDVEVADGSKVGVMVKLGVELGSLGATFGT